MSGERFEPAWALINRLAESLEDRGALLEVMEELEELDEWGRELEL